MCSVIDAYGGFMVMNIFQISAVYSLLYPVIQDRMPMHVGDSKWGVAERDFFSCTKPGS